jgi:protein TIF31
LKKLTLLRSLCQSNGVQILLREYNFDSRHKETFIEDDILNLYPVVKHSGMKLATDAYHFFANGQAKIQQGQLRDGLELVNESYNLLSNVYGALHPDICMCMRLLARLNYILGDVNEAYATQHKCVMMCERLVGLDSPQLVTEYLHLALYAFASVQQLSVAIKYLYRARYLLQLNNGGVGDDHPEMTLIDANLGLVLQANGDIEYALRYLINSLELNKKYFGAQSVKTALAYHLVARAHSCRGDFRTALLNERETYQIYKQTLGEQHERTRESAAVLKHLTEQAVMLQKRMNEITGTKGGANNAASSALASSLMPQIQQPSMQTVLQMLNIINGIFMPAQASEEEMENIRRHVVRYQEQQQQQLQKQIEEAAALSPTVSEKKEMRIAQDDVLE